MSKKSEETETKNEVPELDEDERCCQLRFKLSASEADAMQWLQGALTRIMEKPDHPNGEKAQACLSVVGRLFLLADRSHSLAHIHQEMTKSLLDLDNRFSFDIGESGPEAKAENGFIPVSVTKEQFERLMQTLGIFSKDEEEKPKPPDPSEMN